MTAYNDPRRVRTKLKTLGDEFSDPDIQEALESAHRKVNTKIGRNHSDRNIVTDGDQLRYEFDFVELDSFDHAVHNGVEVDETEYDVDKDEGTITFVDSYVDKLQRNDRLSFSYTPMVFHDLELWYAIKDLLSMSVMQRSDEVKGMKSEEAERHISRLESRINVKSDLATAPDHSRVYL